MCDIRNDLNIIIPGIAFWAYDKKTGKCADQTGYCIAIEIKPWIIYAMDIVGCERTFLNRHFRYEVL